MSGAPTYRGHGPMDYEMCDEYGRITTMLSDGITRGKATAHFAREFGAHFLEIRVTSRTLVWDPASAASDWRDERCECRGGDCTCPWPTDVNEFWDEWSNHSPWRDAGDDDTDTVTIWCAEFREDQS